MASVSFKVQYMRKAAMRAMTAFAGSQAGKLEEYSLTAFDSLAEVLGCYVLPEN